LEVKLTVCVIAVTICIDSNFYWQFRVLKFITKSPEKVLKLTTIMWVATLSSWFLWCICYWLSHTAAVLTVTHEYEGWKGAQFILEMKAVTLEHVVALW